MNRGEKVGHSSYSFQEKIVKNESGRFFILSPYLCLMYSSLISNWASPFPKINVQFLDEIFILKIFILDKIFIF